MGRKNPIVNATIYFYPQYRNEEGDITCYPGSVFEGVVKVEVAESIPVHYIKLVFKGRERVNYDAMGWEKSQIINDRLFAVRTILWGLPPHADLPVDSLPILERGEHTLPFVCQLPVVNYPPTFSHHLITIDFQVIVSILKGGDTTPILSKPEHVLFHPLIETIPAKINESCIQETKLPGHVTSYVSVPRLAYNIDESHRESISINIQLMSNTGKDAIQVSSLTAYIKRYYCINYKTFSRTETKVISSLTYPRSLTKCPINIAIALRIPAKDDIPCTLTFSPHLTIKYKLVVAIKLKQGLIQLRKKIFDMPILFGTLPTGISAPRQLQSYSDIEENQTLELKPTFLIPPKLEQEEFLPVYEGNGRPPAY
ncbi:hypothetical protein BDB01DRAFT_840840 [Pilobolus umbonatus]|nr:hypothetical protein BDB01DRAFT_840840 [Pilobolus umbonatus]